jgi:hypothetical protein
MAPQQNRPLGILLVFGLVSCGLGGCSSSSGNGPPSSGGASTAGGGNGSGGVASTGGTSSSGGASASGGSAASGGTKGSGGVQETGGKVGTGGSNSGGTSATGGSSSPATGGSAAGTGGTLLGGGGVTMGSGGTAKGGTVGGGTSGAINGGAAGGGTSGTSSGACQKGQVKPSEVVFMGESFYAIDPQYNEKRVEADAQAAGALAAGAKYRNVAISGQPMSVVAGEFDTALQGGAVKFVIMDGGGIDAMSSACPSCPDTFKTLLTKMASNGVQNVIYTRYPEPGSPPGSNATLKGNLDTLMPKMQTVCEGSTAPKCHWVDLRPVWQTGDVLTDGLHPTQSGGNHVGDLIWSEMVKDCIAQ